MGKTVLIVLSLLTMVSGAGAGTVVIEAGGDATLIEDPEGGRANGSGPFLFVGRTSQQKGSIRRGLVRFDVAAAIPRHAIIESAALTLFMSPSNSQVREIRLHRVLGDWGEGPSSSAGGGGKPSLPGDATWIHTFYPDRLWVRDGGQFLGRSSAALEVGATAYYTWESTRHTVQDVRLWHANPGHNFGWILMGDETTPQNAKSFASRENPMVPIRPVLTVTYRLPGPPSGR